MKHFSIIHRLSEQHFSQSFTQCKDNVKYHEKMYLVKKYAIEVITAVSALKRFEYLAPF